MTSLILSFNLHKIVVDSKFVFPLKNSELQLGISQRESFASKTFSNVSNMFPLMKWLNVFK